MNEDIFSTEMQIRYNQVDPFGRARNIALMNLLEEAAIEHCHSIDRDVFALLEEGLGWVLHAGSLEFAQYPRYRDTVKIRTWISEWNRLRGIREFKITDSRGTPLVNASTEWVFVDIHRRRPVSIPDEFRVLWPETGERALDAPFFKKPLSLPKNYTTEMFEVRRHDIDSNHHVHNVRYLEWVLETVPEEFFHRRVLESINGTFIREAHLNDQILVQAGKISNSELVHNVVRRSDGEVLSTGRSKWRDGQKEVSF